MKAPDNGTCPYCGSEEIEGDSYDTASNRIFQEMYCLVCENFWDDEYEIVAQLDGDGNRLTEVKK